MLAKDLFTWWLMKHEGEENQESQRTVLHAPPPWRVQFEEPAASREETKEAPRVIIIDL